MHKTQLLVCNHTVGKDYKTTTPTPLRAGPTYTLHTCQYTPHQLGPISFTRTFEGVRLTAAAALRLYFTHSQARTSVRTAAGCCSTTRRRFASYCLAKSAANLLPPTVEILAVVRSPAIPERHTLHRFYPYLLLHRILSIAPACQLPSLSNPLPVTPQSHGTSAGRRVGELFGMMAAANTRAFEAVGKHDEV